MASFIEGLTQWLAVLLAAIVFAFFTAGALVAVGVEVPVVSSWVSGPGQPETQAK